MFCDIFRGVYVQILLTGRVVAILNNLMKGCFFFENQIIAYTAIKAHWLDIAGKEPYSTDTVDVFQEGTVYPVVKLYNKGELVEDIYKMCIAKLFW